MKVPRGSRDYAVMNACLRITGNLLPAFSEGEPNFTSNTCIETSKVLMDLLRAQGLPAFSMPVDITVVNPAWYEATKEGVHPSQRPGWAIGIIAGDDPRTHVDLETRSWNGHLIVRVGREWMMDANSFGFHRPGKIHMPRAWKQEFPEEWRGVKGVTPWHTFGVEAFKPGVLLPATYGIVTVRVRPDNVGYLASPAWETTVSEAFIELGAEIIERLDRGELPDVMRMGDTVVDVSLLRKRWEQEIG